ncbi:oxidoreductase [Streptomyces sp. SID14478]|uniref:oxidoreductase n=1 Tax=Streptomyces sp. SID14478 TaxID=2706073 RepID=UPI0013DA2347|nr:oxidoreductase [Streptomyces sp. SID14478]NEB74268.1 oxidoreductase [Streptomyces sp. SID14478]
MRPDELNPNERQLWHSYTQGLPLVLSLDAPHEQPPALRAEYIAALLLGAGPEPVAGGRPALRLSGATITGTLDLQFADITAPVALTGCRFTDVPLLQGALFRELVLDGCVLPGLNADMLQVQGRLALSGCRLSGPVALTCAEVGSDLDLTHSVISCPGDEAVSAVRLTTGGDLLCTHLTVHGRTRLSGARISGEFDLEGAHLSNPGRTVLDAYHVQVTEDFTFHPGFSAEGEVVLSGATVGAAIGFCGARLRNPGGLALEAVDVTVSRNFDLGVGLSVQGGIKLDGTRIGTRLSFHDATIARPGGTALSMRLIQARESDLRTRTPVEGLVDAGNAQLGSLYDTAATWPARLRLTDTTYDALADPLTATERLAWIQRGGEGYTPQPYEQLAAAYRRLGHEDEARTVLLAKQRHHRAQLPPAARIWGFVQDATVGYGYRPARAALWITVLLAIGALFFSTHPPTPLEKDKAPPFSAVFYALDLLLPVIGFGQKAAFAPHGAGQWLAYTLTATGWILATTVTAGVSRALSRQ